MQKIALEDFLGYTAVSAPTASPAGGAYTWMEHRLDLENNKYIHSFHLSAGDKTCELSDALPGEPFWLDGDTFLYQTAGKGCGSSFSKYHVASGKTEPAFELPLHGRIIAALPDGRYLIMSTVNVLEQQRLAGKSGEELKKERELIDEENDMCWVLDEFPFWQNGQGLTNKLRTGLYIFSPDGDMKRITEEFFDTESAVYVPDLDEIYFTGASFLRQKEYWCGIYAYKLSTGETRCLQEPGHYEIAALELNGSKLVFTACHQDEGKTLAQMHDLYTMDIPGGKMSVLHSGELSFGNCIGSDAGYGGGCGFAVHGGYVYSLICVEERTELVRFSMDGKMETVISITGTVDAFAFDGEDIIFTGMKDMRLPELYRRKPDGEIIRLTYNNDYFFSTRSVVTPERVRFVNAEGNEIHGLVLVPPDFSPEKSYPAILQIHGGPRAAYGEVYHHEMQYLANNGYFVLLCNPTGSLGRGQYFGDVCGKTGQVDFDDLMQFVDTVLERWPSIDPKRLGVTGGSYGGFMTNWVIGHTTRFAAAVSQCSTSNNISNEATTGNGPLFTKSCLAEGQERSDELLWDQSPLKYIDNAVTPTLFIHSLEDYCCYHVEALQMYTALQRLGVDTRVCLFRHEHHSLSRVGKPRARVRRLVESVNWMDKYLK